MPKKDNSSKPMSSPQKKYVKETQNDDDDDVEQDNGKKNIVKKPGRTLLVSPGSGSSMSDSVVASLTGVTKSFSTKNGSYFLTLDTIDNAVMNHKKLRQDHPNLKVKFASYQIFITLKGLVKTDDYTALKKQITEHLEKMTGGIVLYFKLYRKGDDYYYDTKGDEPIGYGDLTLDTKESMDLLLNKEGSLKEWTFQFKSGESTHDITMKSYRFNKTPKNEGQKSSYINQV
jgi:hypothetical protein